MAQPYPSSGSPNYDKKPNKEWGMTNPRLGRRFYLAKGGELAVRPEPQPPEPITPRPRVIGKLTLGPDPIAETVEIDTTGPENIDGNPYPLRSDASVTLTGEDQLQG